MLTIQPTSKAKSNSAKSKAILTSFNVPISAITVALGPVTDKAGYTINTNISFG